MKQHILLCWLLGMSLISHAQTITIIDGEDQLPLIGVTLSSNLPEAAAVSNSEGKVDIADFEGALSIEIRSLGYETLYKSYQELASSPMIYLMQSRLSLDEVVVSATRWSQQAGNLPSKVVRVSAQEVALHNPQTAADLLGLSGKAFIQKSQQGGGSPMIRGFATNRLVYTVDGVRMNTAIFRGGNIQNVISLDPFATESTEVLMGPGSVIYGSDAIGGAMSFQTLTPQLSADSSSPLVRGGAVARYASASNERTAHMDVNIGGKKWSLLSSFSTWDFDHLRQGSHGPKDYLKPYYVERENGQDIIIAQEDPRLQIPSAYSQRNFMQKVRFKPNSQWDIQYGFHLSETSPYGRYDRHNRQRNGTVRYAEWDYGPQKWMMNLLSIAHAVPTKLYDQMTLRLSMQSFEESRIDRSLNSQDRSIRVEQVRAYGVNVDFNKPLSPQSTLMYGLEYVKNEVNSRGRQQDITTGALQRGASRYPDANWASMAAYGNFDWKIGNRLSFQSGVRYNQFILDADFSGNLSFYPFPYERAQINKGALTGSAGFVYRPSKNMAWRVNLGTAFRAPNVDDIGKVFDSEPGAVVVPNPELEAEYAYNIDIGGAKVFGEWLKVDVSAYYTILKNAMIRRNSQLNGLDSIWYDGEMSQVQSLQNAAEARVYGLQASVEIKHPNGLYFLSNINYQLGEERSEEGSLGPSRHAAPLFGNSQLGYQKNSLNVQLSMVYQGERGFGELAFGEQAKDEIYAKDENGNNYSPAWYALHAKALYAFSKRITGSVGIENITDQRYRPYSSGISAAGRNFILSMAVKL